MSNSVPFDETTFRQQFPAYSDTTKYPSATLAMWWDEIGCWITDGGQCGILSGCCTVAAMNMLLAHFLYVADQTNQKAGAGSKGKQGGFKTSASIDKISVSYLAPPINDQFSFWLNSSPYGQQLAAFLEMKAVGGFGIGGLPERTGFRKVTGTFW